MNRYLMYWWFGWCIQLLAIGIGFKFGLYSLIIAADPSYITLVIGIIHIVASCLIGWSIWKGKVGFIEPLWYTAETQLSLGMIGTLIGFIIMLNSAFSNTGADLETVKQSIAMIGTGMGLAIRATLLGLVSGVLIKAQLLILEKKLGQDSETDK